ncbi:MAG: VWA domain-containing protein [Myxococcota bacterium]
MTYTHVNHPLLCILLGVLTLSGAMGCGDFSDSDAASSDSTGFSASNSTSNATGGFHGDGTASSTGAGANPGSTSNNTSFSGNNSTTGSNGVTGGTTNNTSTTGGAADTGNTNVSLGGSQDFGFFRRLLDQNQVPRTDQFDASGFFAEHHTPLPPPDCGERICAQPMLGVMGNLMTGANCTLLQVGLNSPLVADESNRPPLNLAVVVDVSGSMQAQGKIDFVREGLQKMVNELNDDDQIALVTYSDVVSTRYAMQPLRGQRNTLNDIISDLQASGGTNIYDGLEMGYQQLLSHYDSGRQNRLIFLSDGEATAGNTNEQDIINMSRAYNSDGLGLTTVGLGTQFNFTLMQQLALQADGNAYFIEDAGAVDEVFTEELSYFTVPVAFDLELVVNAGADYTFGRALGTPFWEDTDDGGKLSVPSVFLAHRTAHDDITDEGGRRGGGSALLIELMPREDDGSNIGSAHVAHVKLSFREPGTNAIITDTIEVEYPYSPWETLVTGYFENLIVEKSFVMLNIFVALQEACDMFHAGNGSEAIGLLNRLIAAARDYEDSANNGEGDTDIRFDIELMERLVEVITFHDTPPPTDDEIPDDPWPAD